ncbi:MAG: hypothetical protein M3441_05360 [Chloroflexota bacterium]|nr:hypothetical protein [Chloroflexota bacterium]
MDWNWPPEVTVAVIGLIGILLGTIAGGAVSLITTQLNRRDQAIQRAEDRKDRAEEAKHQEERWQAEFFMTLRVDALRDTQRTLIQLGNFYQVKETQLLSAGPESDIVDLLQDQLLPLGITYVQAMSLLTYQLPAAKAQILQDVNELCRAFYNKFQAYTKDPINAAYPPDQRTADLQKIDEQVAIALYTLTAELTPPALKRFLEQ